MKRTLPWVLIIFFIGGACLDEPDCFLLNNNVIGIAFKKLEEPAADSSITVSAFGTLDASLAPELLFMRDTTVTRLNLPLNYFRDETIYFFDDDEANRRILRLGYTAQAQFVSEECGERFVLSALRVLEHDFDSVRLITDTPARQGGNLHLQIFR